MSLAVVQQLYNLSLDPDHREIIVKDQGCLPALVMFMTSTEENVAKTSLETLDLLSQNNNNKETMSKEPGLLSGLKKMAENPEFQSLSDLINKIISSIESTTTTYNTTPTKTPNSFSFNNNSKPATSFSVLVGDKFAGSGVTGKTNSSTVTAATAKTIILFIKGMNNESSKKQVEDCLLRTKGVISFMIDLNSYQATIRSTITADEIKAVIRYQLGLSASLMIDGQEEVDNSPDYLPEVNPAFANQSKKSWTWNSIVSFGVANDPKQTNQGWGWGSISKALFG